MPVINEETMETTSEVKMHTPEPSAKDIIAAPTRTQKHKRRTKSNPRARPFPCATPTNDRRTQMKNEGRSSATKLRRIKRRLFLEAVNSDQHARIKSPRNPIHTELSGKKNRTGKE